MKILLWGMLENNYGPDNINKGIFTNLSPRFWYPTAQGKYRELLDALWKLLRSDLLVVSAASRKGTVLMAAAKLLGKKSVYIMHGCREAEHQINGTEPPKRALAEEAYLLKNADLILPVSRRYMYWAKARYPEYADRMDYIYNGVDKDLFDTLASAPKEPGSVAVSGGMRLLKNNLVVVQAVEALAGKASLKVYDEGGTGIPEQYTRAEWMGKLPHEQFLQALSGTRLFVLNSVQESFSISTMEAFACGCSVLVTEAAGIVDILALEETDIIHDPTDLEEVRGKIDYLLDHPNYDRLRSQFDPEQWSFGKMVENLEKKCEALMRK